MEHQKLSLEQQESNLDQQEPRLSNESSSLEFAPGKVVFEKYEIIRFIAAGGMGNVYQARDIRLNNVVALKVMILDRSSERDFVRFQKEAKTASILNHPNIATIYDFGLVGKTPYLSMEFVDGVSLKTILSRDGIISLEIFITIFVQVCEALIHAHRNGVVHRDIKPDNIVIQKRDTGIIAKILDFGIAKRVDGLLETEGFKTATGEIVGSPLYMSPEQAKSIDVTPKSDIYSLGCAMWQCLSGTSPFAGETAMETIINHQHMRIEDMGAVLPPAVPENLAGLITAMLSKEPEERPELRTILAALLDLRSNINEKREEQHYQDAERTIDRLFEVAPATAFGASQSTPFPYKTAVVASLALVVIACCGFAVFSQVSQKQTESESAVSRPLSTHDMPISFLPRGSDPFVLRAESSELGHLNDNEALILGDGADDNDLRARNNLDEIKVVDLSNSSITENGLAYLEGRVPRLLKLNLSRTQIADLSGVAKFGTLMHLVLEDSPVNDKSLKELKGLNRLTELRIPFTKVSDDGIAKMPDFPRLKLVDLSGLNVSGKTLITLIKKYPALETLRLRQTPLTVADVQNLLKAKPTISLLELKHTENIDMKQLQVVAEKYPCTMLPPLDCPLVTAANAASRYTRERAFAKAQAELERCLFYIKEQDGKESGRSCKFLIAMGQNYEMQDPKSSKALPYFERAATLAKKCNLPGEETAARDEIASLVLSRDGFAASEPHLAEAHEAARRALYDDRPDEYDRRCYRYAKMCRKNKNFQKAAKLYLESAETREKRFSNQPKLLAVALTEAGNCYLAQRKYVEAGKLFDRALSIFERSEEPQNDYQKSSLAMALNGRATVEFYKGDREKALEINKQALVYARRMNEYLAGSLILANRQLFLTRLKRSESELNEVKKELAAVQANLKREPLHVRDRQTID